MTANNYLLLFFLLFNFKSIHLPDRLPKFLAQLIQSLQLARLLVQLLVQLLVSRGLLLSVYYTYIVFLQMRKEI